MKKSKNIQVSKFQGMLNKIKVNKSIVAVVIAVAFLFGMSLWARNEDKNLKDRECVQKGVVTPYACKVVGADVEQDMFAVECFTR